MSVLFQILLLFAALLLISIGLTRLMMVVGPMLGLIDHPSARRIHTTPIPRAGGIAVYLTMLVGFAVLKFSGLSFQGGLTTKWLIHFCIAATLIVAVGVVDDRRALSAWIKLGVQTIAATIVFFAKPEGVGHVLWFDIPVVVDFAIFVGWHVLLINAFNLIDGMDGLCSGLGVISLSILAMLAAVGLYPGNSLVMGVGIFALLGFLRYNFHPARIFLGDAGSMLVGFFIASVGLASVGRSTVTVGILLPLLVAGVPLFDVFLAIWRRTARRLAQSKPGQAAVRIFDPDRDHLHHRLLSWGLSQRQAVGVLYALATIGALLALGPLIGGAKLLTLTMLGLVLIGLVGLRYIAPVELLQSGISFRAATRSPQAGRVQVIGYFITDFLLLTLAACVSGWWLAKVTLRPMAFQSYATHAAVFVAVTLLALRCGQAHVRKWSRASVRDYTQITLWLFCGALVSLSILSLAEADFSFRSATFHFVALAVAVPGMFYVRSIGLNFHESVVDVMHRKPSSRSKSVKHTTLLYGAGDLGELFLCHLRQSSHHDWADFHIVGLIDDQSALNGRYIHGFPILGPLAKLESICRRTKADSLIITQSNLCPQRRRDLKELAEKLHLEIMEWSPDLKPVILRKSDSQPGSGRNENSQELLPTG